MPEPERKLITFTIDGLEVQAPENEWLVDAAKRGDVEIPYFCYERKLGQPVGACRMCMIEIEGMPKLQVSCATPVKDGMVVYTQTDRVKAAQNAVVEFLLVNHPLDCPVCDKGGECPLQDISYGWGPGRSRFVEAKRNFPKPIALSPLVAIDRERCILCYRCVRFSQEVAEDSQLSFLERADHTFVGTFDGRPYVAPFSGNIVELCPVGALTSTPYRFRARPWDIENSGSVCTLCPSQCNVYLTVRDERVERVLARDHPDVDDGWLCDKGRYGFQSIHSEQRITEPLVRDGGQLRPRGWERALEVAIEGLRKAGAKTAAIAGGGTTNEEGFLLQRIVRDALGGTHVDSRAGGTLDPDTARLLARPELSARVSDVDHAKVVLVVGCDPLNESPILDLRVRKAVRRFGARLVVAGSRPTALDGGASERILCAPGGEEAVLRAIQKAMLEAPSESADGEGRAQPVPGQEELLRFLSAQSVEDLAALADVDPQDVRDAARLLVGAESIVILWGERIGYGERGTQTLAALTDLALLAGVDGGEGSGLIEVPAGTNARGLREVGCLPNLGPGFSEAPGAAEIEDASALYLLHVNPVRERADAERWERALAESFVVAHAQFMDPALERHADVVFPAESYPEKEGTITHPDGRIQRLRPAIGHPRDVRMEWQVLAEIAARVGLDRHLAAGLVWRDITEAVPFYGGITLDDIGGRGVRWPERESAAETLVPLRFSDPTLPPAAQRGADGKLPLAPLPDLWASPETEYSPALSFLRARQELQLHPATAQRLGVANGEQVDVASNGNTVRAVAVLREAMKEGCAYLIEGTAEDNANVLMRGEPVLVEVRKGG